MTCFHRITSAALIALASLLAGCIQTKTYEWVEVPGLAQATPRPVQIDTPPPGPAVPPPDDNFVTAAGDRVFFDTARAELSQEGRDTLDRQADWLLRHPEVNARIEGNADLRGPQRYNLQLGQRRANMVMNYLVNRGIDPRRLTAISNGELHPAKPGRDPASLAYNRNAQTVVITVSGR